MPKQPTVGKGTAKSRALNPDKHTEHTPFAMSITAYIDHVRQASGLSIRGVSRISAGQRGLTWWADIFKGEKILTTNDVHYIATELMGISPYELVANARRLSSGQPIPVQTFNVGGITDDDYTQQATEDQRIPTRKVAKRGVPKARRAFEGEDEGSTDDGGKSGA
ncbi:MULTISPECIES: hypothetical protein [unclassified Microbacterium]|uniref:hypothetical protein n=1 Tax=unclassified Microbacterium TaxID=2609290 RepID=UPI000EAA0C09|nr:MULTISPECIES: hypothetical protein [unclassified Microbacterium]MBT2485774.1 hypothetical protein [Microbacterium sp. ISL-108]RKN68537.1 hypothetical protein D7252_13730 [Microbacterium sp. CGR2]